MKDSIEKKFVNFLNNQSDIVELEFLSDWIEDLENLESFRQLVSIHYFSCWTMNQADQEKIIIEIKNKIKSQKQKKVFSSYRFMKLIKYAAIVLLSVCMGYYLNQPQFELKPIKEVVSAKVTLETSEGKQIIIEESPAEVIEIEGKLIAKRKSKTIVYEKNLEFKELKYNTLKVPYGKRFNIELSDGSLVHLNSGTSIKYPVQFIEGNDRRIEIEGEAFFDVTPNENDLFKVKSNGALLTVHGTKFNFKNFPEDSFSEIILTEGSVSVKSHENDNKISIKPNFKAKLNKSGNDIEVTQVNTKLYTSWIDGRVVFRNENIDNLIMKLERLYNVSITNNNQNLSSNFFNATIFIENETIEDVLNYLKEVYNINYQVVNNKIIIK